MQPIVRTEYIRQQVPPLPDVPEYYPVDWENNAGDYCVNAWNAKNLLKNRALDKGYQEEMRNILLNLKDGNK